MRLLDPGSPEVEAGIKRLNGAKVRFPEGPIDIDFYFGYHGYAEHVEPDLITGLQQADIFTVETVGWSPEGSELRERIASGDEEAAQELNHITTGFQKEFWKRVHSAMFGSRVRVHHPDVPEGHALVHQYRRMSEEAAAIGSMISQVMTHGGQLPSRRELDTTTRQLFAVLNKRDRYILEHFFPKDFPEGDVRMVGFFGVLHKGVAVALAHKAAQQGRDDIRVSVNDFQAPHITDAYDDFLQQREPTSERLTAFLTTRVG